MKKLSSLPEDDLDQWGSRFLVRSEEDISLPHHAHRSKFVKFAMLFISLSFTSTCILSLFPTFDVTGGTLRAGANQHIYRSP